MTGSRDKNAVPPVVIVPRHLKGPGAVDGMRCISEENFVYDGGEFRGRTLTFVPASSRKDEQAYLTALEALCRNQAFRRDIQKLRTRYPESYWKQDHREQKAYRDAEQLCYRWRFEGTDWVLWVVRNWDPDTAELPPSHAMDYGLLPLPLLGNWIIKTEFLEGPGMPEQPRRAILTLDASISVREAQKAAAMAIKALGLTARDRGSRPGLTNLDHEWLQAIFATLGVPPNRKRTEMIRTVAEIMKRHLRPLSQSVIAKELNRWLAKHGQKVKRYVRE